MSDYSNQNSQNFSQSSAFAAALQRAKQIAAKIHPGGGQPVKRTLEDDSGPESKKFGGQSDYNNANSPTGMSPAAMQAAAQAAAVAARLSQINNNSNSNSSAGAQDPVQRARDLISKMVNQQGGHNGPMDNGNNHGGGGGGGGGRGGFGSSNFNNQPFQEIMIPGSKVGLIIGKGGETIKQLQEKSGAKMVIIQDGPGQEMEKPLRISGDPHKVEMAKQLVYDLIQEKDNYTQRQTMNGTEQAEVFVPKSAVGVVIGKGGDMIKKIQGESGCKLQFIQGRGDGPGDRRCIVQGSRAQVEEGKRMIEELIESVQRREQQGGGRGRGERDDRGDRGDRPHRGRDSHDNGNGGQYGNEYSGPQVTREEYTFTVPVNKCGIIIGRGGDTIKQINQQSGAHTEMDRKVSANQTTEKTFTCKGEPHQVEEAKRLIQEKINMEINLVYVGTSTAPAQQYQNNGQNAYGQGWGGYQQQSWDQTQQVQASAATAVAAQQQQQAGGQADYSQQWIEYYRGGPTNRSHPSSSRQMGMHREAEMIEQQVKARQVAAQQGATAPPAVQTTQANPTVQGQSVVATSNAGAQQSTGGGQADYSAEWAEYYRRLGRIDEAEAIEKQIATNKAPQVQTTTGGQPGNAAGQPFNAASGGPGAAGGNPQQMAAQQAAAAGGYGAQQYQQYYAGAAAAGGQPGGYQGYPYGGGYPGQQGGQPGQQPGGQGQDKN
ncbi:far upstream element-binding protein 3 isoform X3 [Toxorhynchites rutilus septentrionalis]|uniref:far upstream element-binding protein 3 isoform X3 n=1 Tax=Toxorhynchites rutilus septentrionalis TaxID=329112 RepID=UPI002478F9DB|nr:far upstream element-binding protein 3 isoform X3 [Toxorhynchites rutilus septentrionalis]